MNIKKASIALSILLICIINSSCNASNNTKGNITGSIFDENNNSIDATITLTKILLKADGDFDLLNEQKEIKTNHGLFTFTNIYPGNYVLHATIGMYTQQIMGKSNILIITVKPSETNDLGRLRLYQSLFESNK
jgi:hypothetical protein